MTLHTRKLVLVAMALLGLGMWGRAPLDPDLGWHLLGGAWMHIYGGVPRADFINAFNTNWHDYHWLAQRAMDWIYRMDGFRGLQISLGVMGAVLFAGIWCLGAKVRGHTGLALSIVSVAVMSQALEIRPQVISLLILCEVLLILDSGRSAWRFELPVLLLFSVALVNIHVFWVFIPVLWFFHRCLPRFLRKRSHSAGYAWGGLAALAASGLVSPYGLFQSAPRLQDIFLNYFVLFEYTLVPAVLRKHVHEMQGAFSSGGLYPWVTLLYMGLLIRAFCLKRALADVGRWTVACTFAVLSLYSVKYVPLLSMAIIPYASRHLRLNFGWMKAEIQRTRLESAVLLVTVGCAAWSLFQFPRGEDYIGELSQLYPIEACQKIHRVMTARAGHQPVRVATHFDHGGWCSWAAFQSSGKFDTRVSTDNRTQWVPKSHYRMATDLYFGQRDWYQTLELWNPDAVVVIREAALAQLLLFMPKTWERIYSDAVFFGFVRDRRQDSGDSN